MKIIGVCKIFATPVNDSGVPSQLCTPFARRVGPAVVVGLFAVACATGTFDDGYQPPTVRTEPLPNGGPLGKLQGVIRVKDSAGKFDGALVVIQCSCLPEAREVKTNLDGIYNFPDLPPGEYTIQVLSGQADISRQATVKAGFKVRADFTLDFDRGYTVT